MGPTHMVGAALGGFCLASATGIEAAGALAVAGGAVAAAKAPDLDGHYKRRKRNGRSEDRSATHSLLIAGPAVVALAALAGAWLAAAGAGGAWELARLAVHGAAVGYISHLLLDAGTPSGIPWLLPGGSQLRLGLVGETGGFGERVVCAVLLAGCGVIVLDGWAPGGVPGTLVDLLPQAAQGTATGDTP